MNIEVFTGVAPDFKPLQIVEINCCQCGARIRLPAQQVIDGIANTIEDYYARQCSYLSAENAHLRKIIETGNSIALIEQVTKRL